MTIEDQHIGKSPPGLRILLIGSSPTAGLLYHPVRLAVALAQAGHTVCVASKSREGLSPELPELLARAGVELVIVGSLGLSGPRALLSGSRDIEDLIGHFRPDVIHTFGPISARQCDRRQRTGPRPRRICMVEAMGHEHISGLRRQLQRFGGLLLNRHADAVLALCHLEKLRLRSMGVQSRRLSVMFNPLDCADVIKRAGSAGDERPRIRGLLGLPAQARLVGCFANFQQRKRHDLVIKAFANLVPDYPDLRLVLAGEGATQQACRLAIEALGLGKKAIVLPRLPATEVYKYLNACDAIVHISNAETFGFSMIEPLLLRKPTLLSRVGIGWEIEQAGGALVIPPDDLPATISGLRRLVDARPAELDHMIDRGEEFVRTHCDTAAIAARLTELYRERTHD